MNSGRQNRMTTSPTQTQGARAQAARRFAYGLMNTAVQVKFPVNVMLFEQPDPTHPEKVNPA